MRGNTDFAPHPSTQLARQSENRCGDPASKERDNGAAVSGSAAKTLAECLLELSAEAMPQDKPPPPNDATTQSTSGRSSKISSPIDALPAMNSSSSKG